MPNISKAQFFPFYEDRLFKEDLSESISVGLTHGKIDTKL